MITLLPTASGPALLNCPSLPTFIMTQHVLISLEKMRISSLWLAIWLPALAGSTVTAFPPVDEAVPDLLLPRLPRLVSVQEAAPLLYCCAQRDCGIFRPQLSMKTAAEAEVGVCLFVQCSNLYYYIRLSGLVWLVKWRLHPFVVEHVWQSWTCHKTHHPHDPSWGG